MDVVYVVTDFDGFLIATTDEEKARVAIKNYTADDFDQSDTDFLELRIWNKGRCVVTERYERPDDNDVSGEPVFVGEFR